MEFRSAHRTGRGREQRARRMSVVAMISLSSLLLLTSHRMLASATEESKSLPANHRAEVEEAPREGAPPLDEQPTASKSQRRGRQYDSHMSSSSTGNYAAVSGDTGAYVGSSLPLGPYSGAGPNGLMGTAYGPEPSLGASVAAGAAGYPATGGYHDQMSMGRGYGPPLPPPSVYGPTPMAPSGGSALASMFPLLGSPSAGFPLMAKGFDISEIVCTAVAVAIGAIIVGAPFILLYLFVMNQMQANGPGAMGPGGGSISLTGPTATTNVGGRKKRHTSFPEALLKQLSPLVNSEQVAQAFKMLMNSVAKYQA